MSAARVVAAKKLIAIYKGSSAGSAKQVAAILALGRVGGLEAANALSAIYDGASAGSKKQLASIEALGEVGRG